MDLSKKFISQGEIDEVKQKRQEEWEKKRTPDQPIECPEEEVDNRSLFDKLEEQKLKKKEEEEEKYRLKNCVKGLADEEVTFLDFVSQRQIELNKARNSEEASILQEIRESAVSTVSEIKSADSKKSKPQVPTSSNKKSQQALLAGAVKRKSTDTSDDNKKRKLSQEENSSGLQNEAENRLSNKNSSAVDTEKISQNANSASCNHSAKVIGVLPGLGAYNNDTSDSESSSSDSETEFKIMPPKKIVIHYEDE